MSRVEKTGRWRAGIRQHPDRRTSRSIVIRGVLLTVVLIALVAPGTQLRQVYFVVEKLEFLGYDLLLRTLPTREHAEGVVIVDVDEASLEALGQWPWPRDRFARLIDRVHDAGAAAIGVDFIFAEPDELSVVRSAERIREKTGIDIAPQLADSATELVDNDAVLADALNRPNVISAVWLESAPRRAEEARELPIPQTVVRASAKAPENPFPHSTSATLPTPALRDAVGAMGFVNALPDSDGAIRRMPLVYGYHRQLVPAISLAMVMAARGEDSIEVRVSDAGAQSVRIGETTVPTDHQGSMFIPFREPYDTQFTTVPAKDVLAGTVDETLFEDAVVLVGTTVTALKDTSPVPGDNNLAGIRIHAMAIAALMAGDFIRTPPYDFLTALLSTLVACALATYLIARRSLMTCVVLIGALVVLVSLGSQWLFVSRGIYVSPVPGVLTLLLVSTLLGVTRIRGEESRALRSVQELAVAQDCAILGLVSVAETRDPETGSHILRTQHYVRALADRMASFPEYRKALGGDTVDILFRSAPLHDIGKVGVPDRVLLKPGKLTEEEFAIMKLHTVHGHEVLTHAERMSGVDAGSSFLRCAAEIAKSHHEKWDGSGYPEGLARYEIPLSARMMALADVYDALRSKRHYKDAFTHEKTRGIIVEDSGVHFDPEVVRAFLDIEEEFIRIARRYSEDDGPTSSLHDYPEHDGHVGPTTNGQ